MCTVKHHFVYFLDTEGGMDLFDVSGLCPETELRTLTGWMNSECKQEDQELLNWMEGADVGTMFEHRLGVLVRMRDRG